MKYIVSIEDKTYLLWQTEIQIWNFLELGILHELCIVIIYNTDTPSEYAIKLSTLADVKFYKSTLAKTHYSPTNKVHGIRRLLQEFPDYGKRLFSLDSDVLFKERLDFSFLDGNRDWWFSDCSSYINYSYVSQHLSDEQLETLFARFRLDFLRFKSDPLGGGAQCIYQDVDWEFFQACENSSTELFDALSVIVAESEGKNKLQIWTAEMWSVLWESQKNRIVRTHAELDFAWATDSKEAWGKKKILHFAGVTKDLGKEGFFDKTAYLDTKPWNTDLSCVTKTETCSHVYVEKIEKYRNVLSS